MKELQKHRTELMDQAEKILEGHRYKLRQQKVQRLREYSHPKCEYHKKVNFIEGHIEKDILYYGAEGEFMSQIQSIKEKVRKINNV